MATYVVLRLTQRKALASETAATDVKQLALSTTGKLAAGGVVLTGVVLTAVSAYSLDLGLPTFIAGAVTACLILISKRESPLAVAKDISCGVLPLVAGLFVLVEALDRTGVIQTLSELVKQATAAAPREAAGGAGVLVAIASNLVNNLPAGLVAGSAIAAADVPKSVAAAILIGVNLGPNLSVTGSLATILWLTALRREGQNVNAWRFLKLGLLVMPAALLPAIAILLPVT